MGGDNDMAQDHRSAKAKVSNVGRRVWRLIAGLGVVIGAVAGFLAIIHSSASSGPPKFSGLVSTKGGATAFADFLRMNDGRVVYLNVVCDQYVQADQTSHLEPGDHCVAWTESNYSSSSPKADLLTTFDGTDDARQWWNGQDSPATERQAAWTWIPWKGDNGVDASISNGSYGAGFEVVKGYYEVLLGEGGSGPPDAQSTELLAVSPPS